jgi:hypothetical protein
MLGDSLTLQKNIMKYLNGEIEKLPQEGRQGVYRLCSVELGMENGQVAGKVDRATQIPLGLADGTSLVEASQNDHPDLAKTKVNLQNAIASNVITTLEQSGQLAYLKSNEMLNQKDYSIKVDVDFYYSRPKNAVGFHKDTTGRTMFVNLNFNNESDMLGPEYVLNPSRIPSHEQHIQGKHLLKFQQHLDNANSVLGSPQLIEATVVKSNGVVSFVDELIHHSTPYPEHRGITREQLLGELNTSSGPLCQSLRTSKQFIDLHDSAPADKIVSADDLRKMSLPDDKISYLMPDGKSMTVEAIRTKLIGNKELQGMRDQLSSFEQFLARPDTIQRHELIEKGMSEQEVGDIFTKLGKPNMDVVSTAHCEHECHIDTKSQQAPLDTQANGKPLPRRMSMELDAGNQPPSVEGNRQFFRTWVQAIPK